jgi:hypothetical protein
MSTITPPARPPRVRPPAMAFKSTSERYTHVVLRLQERGGITWTTEHVHALEKKIKFVRSRINQQLPVAGILPKKIGEAKNTFIHYYRVLIAGAPHTFIWSQTCRGLISYRGPGENCDPLQPPVDNAAVAQPQPEPSTP